VAAVGLKLGKGFAAFSQVLDPKINQRLLQKHVGRATGRIAVLGKRRVREYIRAGVPTTGGAIGVAELTSLTKKGEKRPIVGTEGLDLFNSVVGRSEGWATAIIGSYRFVGDLNVSKLVHEGATIPVTQRMRNMFWLLWLVDQGKYDPNKLTGRAAELYRLAGSKRKGGQKFKRLAPSTTVIVIPPRPFLSRPLIEDANFRRETQEIWTEAVRATFREQASKGERI
jgi:hypothetical protein